MKLNTDSLQDSLLVVADKMSSNKVLKSISNGFSTLLPIIMVGAIASLLSGLNFEAYQTFITNTGLATIFSYVSTYTTNMLSIYAVFVIAKNMAENLECKNQSTIVGVTALMIFLLMIPTGVGEGDAAISGAINTTYFGSSGLFSAMILGIVIPLFYNLFIKYNIVIKMPESVPPTIARSFSAIIPAFAATALFVVVRQLCALTSYGTFNDMIYGILRTPLAALTNSPVTFAIFCVLCNLLWWFGIHGGMVVSPFLSMLYLAPALENMEAYAAGAAMPNILTNTWWFTFVQVGGCGGVIGLVLLMIFASKSKMYKTLGKLAAVPAICGISEPLVFGTPMVLNPLMLVPMIGAPLVSFILGYLLTIAGILPVLNGIQLSTGTPVILSGFLAGGWQAALWQVIIIALQVLIYMPFFKIADKKAMEEEEVQMEQEETASLEVVAEA